MTAQACTSYASLAYQFESSGVSKGLILSDCSGVFTMDSYVTVMDAGEAAARTVLNYIKLAFGKRAQPT